MKDSEIVEISKKLDLKDSQYNSKLKQMESDSKKVALELEKRVKEILFRSKGGSGVVEVKNKRSGVMGVKSK